MQKRSTDEEIDAGIVFQDPLLFALMFWKGDLTTPESREDLPKEIRGKQVLSREQKLMYCDQSRQIIFCTGRKIAKSLKIEALIIQKSICHVQNMEDDAGNEEALVFAPSEGHLMPMVARVYSRIERTPIFSAMKGRAIRGNKPQIDWHTGLTVYFRVEGMTGTDTNMAGIRAKWVLGDEMAFGDWQNHNSRVQTALPNADWLYAGVPNGVRNSPFYEIDQTNLGRPWSRHKYNTFVNPLYWSDIAQETLLEAYGSKNTTGYITQVEGQWGEEMVSSFPPSSIAIHNNMHFTFDITSTQAKRIVGLPNMRDGISIPNVVCEAFAIGCDYGFSPDPTVAIIAIQQTKEDVRDKVWRQYARITMRAVPMPTQAKILMFIMNNVMLGGRFIGFASDRQELIQTMHEMRPALQQRIVWAHPGHHVIPKDRSGNPLVHEEGPDKGKIVKRGCKQFWTETLKDAMSFYLSELPPNPFYYMVAQDDTVINELVGTTETKGSGGYTTYKGPPDPGGAKRKLDHNTDAMRELMAAILYGVKLDTNTDTEMALLKAMGWAGVADEQEWSAPWADDRVPV